MWASWDADSMAGVGVTLLQLAGVCPLAAVSSEGAYRVGWVPTTWCALFLVVRGALLVWYYQAKQALGRDLEAGASISARIGEFVFVEASQLCSYCISVMLLLATSRLARLLLEMDVLRKMLAAVSSSACWSPGPLTLVYACATVGFFVWTVIRYTCYTISRWATNASWLPELLHLLELVLGWPSHSGVMFLLTSVLAHLCTATRAVLPPQWEQLLAQVREGTTHSPVLRESTFVLPGSLPTAATAPAAALALASFLRHARALLQQTEEMVARLMEYLGVALLVIVTTNVLSFTFSAYFSFLKWNAGFTDYYHFSQMAALLLTLLQINMAAEDLLQERRRCARLYRRLLLHHQVEALSMAGEVAAALDRPLQMRVTQLFNLGGTCVTTMCSLVLSYLVIALQFSSTQDVNIY
ncbi:uncharacterized protein LOC123501947 [Portunus trituberculatus]|uniref:uncharacterized protein LOC123501947 n=1 Tax=Portunus trituberculatus TaxID=210409 RepID=UPI001E1CFD50|nr:uncharacterized protein LOC123501947 [Portunus trituberculatus]